MELNATSLRIVSQFVFYTINNFQEIISTNKLSRTKLLRSFSEDIILLLLI